MTIAYREPDGDYDEVVINDYFKADYKLWLDKETVNMTEAEKETYIKKNRVFVFNKINVHNFLDMIDELSNNLPTNKDRAYNDIKNTANMLGERVYNAVSRFSVSVEDALDMYYEFIHNWKIVDDISYVSFNTEEWASSNIQHLVEDAFAYPVDLKLSVRTPSEKLDSEVDEGFANVKNEIKDMGKIIELLNQHFNITSLDSLEKKIEKFKRAEAIVEDCIAYANN